MGNELGEKEEALITFYLAALKFIGEHDASLLIHPVRLGHIFEAALWHQGLGHLFTSGPCFPQVVEVLPQRIHVQTR
jgi:hypothetical protein